MMTNEALRIREMAGQENPFRTPEGYFEGFNARLFERLPQRPSSAKTVRLVPRLLRYAAAVVLVAGVGSVMVWNYNRTATSLAYSDEMAQEEYYNDALDYIMVGNMEIADYLTEAE